MPIIITILIVLQMYSPNSNDLIPTQPEEDYVIGKPRISEVFEDIIINDLLTTNTTNTGNWTWARAQSWCYQGSGTSEDPYIIEYETFVFASGDPESLRILNSRKHFIMRYCNITDSQTVSPGLLLSNVTNGQILNNYVFDNGWGIVLVDVNDTVISDNQVYNNRAENGIQIQNSYNNVIRGNFIYNNTGYGIRLEGSSNNNISETTNYNNKKNGFYIEGSHNNLIFDNNIRNNTENGIELRGSTLNIISDNSVYENGLDGIVLDKLGVDASDNNNISGNFIKDNVDRGIFLDPATINNLIWENFFLRNGIHAIDDSLNNNWNSTTIGNYWDNHTGPDVNDDGIVDIQYNISGSAGGIDYLPIAEDGAPAITINLPDPDGVFAVNSPSFNVRITDDYLNEMWYTIDGGFNNFTFTVNETIDQTAWAAMAEGGIIVTFYASDIPGNIGTTEVVIDKDLQLPILNINSPTLSDLYGVNAPSFNIRVIEDHVDTLWYTMDGGVNNYTFTVNGSIDQSAWNAMTDGAIMLKFYANDTIGHSVSAEVSIIKDGTAPIIVINSPVDSEEFGNEPPLFNITVTDLHLDSIWYSFDDGVTTHAITDNTEFNQTAWATLPEGNVIITFYADDTAGNEASESVTVVKNIPAGSPYAGVIITVLVVSIVGGVSVVVVAYIFIKKRGMT